MFICFAIGAFCLLAFFACAFAADQPSGDVAKEEALARGFAGGALIAFGAGLVLMFTGDIQ